MTKNTIVAFLLSFFVFIPSDIFAVTYSWSSLTDFKGIDQFNLFLKGDLKYFRSDVEGRVAVGGNAELKGFDIGLKAPKNDFNLIVGGELAAGGLGNGEGGQVNNGGIYARGDIKLQRVGLPQGNVESKGKIELEQVTVNKGDVKAKNAISFKNAATGNGNVESGGDVNLKDSTVSGDVKAAGNVSLDNSGVTGTIISQQSGFSPSVDDPFDFDIVDLESISNNLLHSTNGNITGIGTGSILLECNNPLVCYFNISASVIENAGFFEIKASNDKTVVINVTGNNSNDKDLTVANIGFRLLGGIRSPNILYNFVGFDFVLMHNLGLPGSILAPNASIDFYEGNMEGVLMAYNLTGGSWNNNIRGGQINVPVSEPFTIFMVLTGLIFLAVFYRCMRGGKISFYCSR